MRNSWWPTGLLVASLLSSLATGWPWIMLSHDVLLYRFLASVVGMELPEGTRVLAAETAFGVLVGGSNHCDAAVMAVLSSDRSYEALTQALPPVEAIAWPWFPSLKGYTIFAVEGDRLYSPFQGGSYPLGPDGRLVSGSEPQDIDHGLRDGVNTLLVETAHVPGRRYLLLVLDQYYGSVDLRCH